MDIQTPKLKQSFKCKFCDISFSKEKTLLVHLCEPRRRFDQRDEKPIKVAFMAYTRFYELTQYNAPTSVITIDDFEKCQYYKAFVKFGWHMHHIKAIDQTAFIEYVITKKIRLDDWCKDAVYDNYMISYVMFERADKAIERSLNTMIDWAEENNSEYNHFFKYVAPTVVTYMIQTGRISPWALYGSETGIGMLDKMSDEQHNLISNVAGPTHWSYRFKNESVDFDWVKHVLKEAGL